LSAPPTGPGADPTDPKPSPDDEDDDRRVISRPPVDTTTTPPVTTPTATETPPPVVVVSPPDESVGELLDIFEEEPPLVDRPPIEDSEVIDDPQEELVIELEDDIVPLGELPETGRSSFYLLTLGLGALVTAIGVVLLLITKNRKSWNR